MTTIYTTHPRYTEHDAPGHPEHAERIRAVWQHLDANGLSQRLNAVTPKPISDDLILTVHTPEYLKVLHRVSEQSQQLHLDADTYAGPDALTIAKLSAGGAVEAVEAVLNGSAANGLAAIRPPGHHAMPGHGMGFCLIGNVAIAARYAQQRGIQRVLIVDYDVHHGNGTEAMFYTDSSVLFISTHQYPLYPGTGAVTDIGAKEGEGYNINIPLPPSSGDSNYRRVFDEIVLPVAERFAPELILVSAGFDAHWRDPLAGMQLTLDGYTHLARELLRMADQLCGGKIVFVMEGGYDLDALSGGVGNVARLLLGDEPVDKLGKPDYLRPEPEITALIKMIKQVQDL